MTYLLASVLVLETLLLLGAIGWLHSRRGHMLRSIAQLNQALGAKRTQMSAQRAVLRHEQQLLAELAEHIEQKKQRIVELQHQNLLLMNELDRRNQTSGTSKTPTDG